METVAGLNQLDDDRLNGPGSVDSGNDSPDNLRCRNLLSRTLLRSPRLLVYSLNPVRCSLAGSKVILMVHPARGPTRRNLHQDAHRGGRVVRRRVEVLILAKGCGELRIHCGPSMCRECACKSSA